MPTRRTFIACLMASAAVPALVPVAADTAPLVLPPAVVPPVVTMAGYWGHTNGGDHYYDMGLGSKEAVLAEMNELYPEGGYSVAWCVPIPISVPDDYGASLAEWMAGCSLRTHFATVILDRIEGYNEDADFEGDFAEELFRVDKIQFFQECRAAFDFALVRAGRLDLIGRDFSKEPLGDTDPVLDQIEKDAALQLSLDKATRSWFDRADLWDAGARTLTVSQETTIPHNEDMPDIAYEMVQV